MATIFGSMSLKPKQASKGTIVISKMLSNTNCADSGSLKMLNSEQK